MKYDGTNVWKQRWVCYNEHGQRVFTLLFLPKSSIIRSDAAMLEVENEWLYHGLGIDGVMNLMHQVCPFQVNGMSRCDIAADFCPDERQAEIIQGLAVGKYRVGGKQNGAGFWSYNYGEWVPEMWRGKRIPHQSSWGHKTSAVKWKLYYKSKELRDAVGGVAFDKPYIVDMWRENGMDINNVWRLEVSITKCNQHEVCGDKFTYPLFKNNMAGVFHALVRERFDVRLDEGHKDKSNDTQVDFLNLEDLFQSFRCRRPQSLAQRNGRITLLRHLTQSIDTPEVLLDDNSREMVFSHISSLLCRDGLKRYFRQMVGEDYDDWVEKKRVEAYNGMYEDGHDAISTASVEDKAMLPNEEFSNHHDFHEEWQPTLPPEITDRPAEDTIFGRHLIDAPSRMKNKRRREECGEFKRNP